MQLGIKVHSQESKLDVLKAVLVISEKEELGLAQAYHQLKVQE